MTRRAETVILAAGLALVVGDGCRRAPKAPRGPWRATTATPHVVYAPPTPPPPLPTATLRPGERPHPTSLPR